jgi:hypothetical protein
MQWLQVTEIDEHELSAELSAGKGAYGEEEYSCLSWKSKYLFDGINFYCYLHVHTRYIYMLNI